MPRCVHATPCRRREPAHRAPPVHEPRLGVRDHLDRERLPPRHKSKFCFQQMPHVAEPLRWHKCVPFRSLHTCPWSVARMSVLHGCKHCRPGDGVDLPSWAHLSRCPKLGRPRSVDASVHDAHCLRALFLLARPAACGGAVRLRTPSPVAQPFLPPGRPFCWPPQWYLYHM